MARIRTVKPEFWEDEDLGCISRDARLLFIACFNIADDEGRMRWNPTFIKSKAFLYDDDLSLEDVARLMAELEEGGFVAPYIGGKASQRLAVVVNFLRHQKINRPQPSKIPAPDTDSVNDSAASEEGTSDNVSDSRHDSVSDSENVTELFTDGMDGEREGKGKGSGARAKRAATPPPQDLPVSESMVAWWRSQNRPDIDPRSETQKFLNHHRAKGTTFKDWEAAWRNWMLKAIDYSGPPKLIPGVPSGMEWANR